MLTAKFSDVLGLKTTLVACNVFFLIFSSMYPIAQTYGQSEDSSDGVKSSGMWRSKIHASVVRPPDPICRYAHRDRIIFRAFQGIGGSGMYSLVFVAIMQLITPEKSGFYSGVISSVFAIANLLGPLLGGVIVDRTTWRWIFWIKYDISLLF